MSAGPKPRVQPAFGPERTGHGGGAHAVVASNARLTLKAINDERRLNAQIISYRMEATPTQFPSRNRKTKLLMHSCLDQSLGTGAGGRNFHHDSY